MLVSMEEKLNGSVLRTVVKGKFFQSGEDRFYVKGATYGTFRPDKNGFQFPPAEIMDNDFKMMSGIGINSIRIYTAPSDSLLNIALKYNLKVMVGLPWEQHLTFLNDRRNARKIVENVREIVYKCRSHPAILCYSIGNEIPATIVRWYDQRKITKFLKKLYNTVKEIDPEALVTYVNYPTTEYLDLPFLDFFCYNVYLETKEKLSAYLNRLHNLVGEKPLVLTEIGFDSLRNGTDYQAFVLDWQVRTIFEKGFAGAFVFSWTDEWWRGGAAIEDWDFGLVDRERNAKPSLFTIQRVMKDVPILYGKEMPSFSVVICSHNGSKTIRDTIEGCMGLDYPDFEIIVVNDGSTDSTREITEQYPVRLINTVKRGLSNARNTGIYAANGDIIAFTDDDAYPESYWLKYLASLYISSDFAGIGGPNLAVYGEGFVADCVANSPGRPSHVLTTDEVAEHIPGCNMSFRKLILIEVGGFDPVFRSAGDDVDICWRIQQKGYTIGFHPAAIVWHHCRNSIRMYWKQQKGYGKAEALLEKKWTEKYNSFGHLSWAGSIYGIGLTKSIKLRRNKIYFGSQGLALFQSVYQPASGFFKALPLMPEWYLLIGFLGFISGLGIEWKLLLWAIPAFIGSVLIILFQAAISARHALSNYKHGSGLHKKKFWILTSFLHLLQPLARLTGRITNGLTIWKISFKELFHINQLFIVSGKLEHWSEVWYPAEVWLERIQTGLQNLNNRVKVGGVFDRWDLQNRIGLLCSVRSLLAIEEHGMGRQMLKLKRQIKVSKLGIISCLCLGALCFFAFRSQAYFAFAVLSFFTTLHVLKILTDASGAFDSIRLVMQNLPSGIHKENENGEQVASGDEQANNPGSQVIYHKNLMPEKLYGN